MIIRKLKEDERNDFGKICRYAFQPSKNNYENIDFPDESHDINQLYGAFDKDKLVATGEKFPFAVKIRNTVLNCNGIAAVATKPEYRNRGIVKKIFQTMFQDMKVDNEVLSILYPFKYSFYEKLGYYCVQDSELYHFRIQNIKKRNTTVHYQFKEVERITQEMKDIYHKITNKHNYMAIRTDYMWKRKEKSNYKFICFNNQNEPVGYILLHFPKETPFWSPIENEEKTISIWEMFYLDDDVKQAMFNFLWVHRDQRKYIVGGFPMGELVNEYLDSPRIKSHQIRPGSMLRIMDVSTVLSQITYPKDIGDFKIGIWVKDQYCDWNNDVFIIKRENQTTSVYKKSGRTDDIDLEIDIGHLAQLVAGYRTIDELSEINAVKYHTSKKELLGQLFPKATNFFRDFF